MSQRETVVNIANSEENFSRKIECMFKFIHKLTTAFKYNKIANIEKLVKNNKSLLNNEILELFDKSTSKDKQEIRRPITDLVLKHFYSESQGNDSRLFFCAALLDLEKLKELLSSGNLNFNQIRLSDSVLLFVMKHGDVEKENLVECIKLLIAEGTDINKFDFFGNSAVDYVSVLYQNHKTDKNIAHNLNRIARLLLEKGIHEPDNPRTRKFLNLVMNYSASYLPMSEATRAFRLIARCKCKISEDAEPVAKLVPYDNGEDNVLQFVCKRSDKLLPLLKLLLESGADVNTTSKWNKLSCLELSAEYKNRKIFREILQNKETKIQERHFNNLVGLLSDEPALFRLLLESGKINPHFKYDKSRNTPLHYAISQGHKHSIHELLSRDAPLLTKNKDGVRALDIIGGYHLETFLDSRLLFTESDSFFDNYGVKMSFECLKDAEGEEVGVICGISTRAKLEYLLEHPVVYTFVALKSFKTIVYLSVMIFLLLVLSMPLAFLYNKSIDTTSRVFCALSIYSALVLKLVLFIQMVRLYNTSRLKLANYKLKTIFNFLKDQLKGILSIPVILHVIVDVVLMVILLCSFFLSQLEIIVSIVMIVSILLTGTFHLTIATYYTRFLNVIKNYLVPLILLPLLVLFSVSSIVPKSEPEVPSDETLRSDSPLDGTSCIFTVIGSIKDFILNFFANGALIIFVFISISIGGINLWTALSANSSDSLGNKIRHVSLKNMILFMTLIETKIYRFDFVKKYCPTPLLFSNAKGKLHKFELKFMVDNRRKLRKGTKRGQKIDNVCLEKIHYYYRKTKDVADLEKLIKIRECRAILDGLDRVPNSL